MNCGYLFDPFVLDKMWSLFKEEFEDIPKGNQNPYIEEEQTIQWPKEKGQTTIYKTYT